MAVCDFGALIGVGALMLCIFSENHVKVFAEWHGPDEVLYSNCVLELVE